MKSEREQERLLFAAAALMGMLAHSTRYKPRDGKSANWHEAIAEEALEIGEAMCNAAEKLK